MNKKIETKEPEELDIFQRDTKLNIHQRINAIMAEWSYVKKNKKIELGKGGFTVTGHDAITAFIHPLLVKHGVNLIPCGQEMTQDGNRTRIDMTFEWVNIDTPDDMYAQKWFGYGIDTSDKGPGKAVSYIQRYVVLKTLHIEKGDKDLEDYQNDFKRDVIPHSKEVQESVAGEDGDIPLTPASGQNISKGAVVALEKLFKKHEKEQRPILDQFQIDTVQQILIKDYGAVKDLITA